jgi:hypothetical protein
VTEAGFAFVDSTLLCISEARERAETAVKELRGLAADASVVAALEDADRELLALHRRLMDAVYFPHQREQLRLTA